MTWIRRNWHGLLPSAFSLLALALLAIQAAQHPELAASTTDSFFEQTGRWAIRLLLVCLAMTPLRRIFGWRAALKLRKPVGLWAFGFAAIHFVDYTGYQPYNLAWVQTALEPFILPGVAALIILTALAVTSNQWAMRRLKRGWKRLHRLVYGAAILAAVHGVIAAAYGKKAFFRDPSYRYEMNVYLVILVVLLVLRVPVVQRKARHLAESRRQQKTDTNTVPVIERYIEESDLMETVAEPEKIGL